MFANHFTFSKPGRRCKKSGSRPAVCRLCTGAQGSNSPVDEISGIRILTFFLSRLNFHFYLEIIDSFFTDSS